MKRVLPIHSWPVMAQACAFATAVAIPLPARAQTASERETVDQDVIVTARKRDELLEKVAAPVSAVTGEQLIEKGISRAEQLNEAFPALTVQPTATGNLIFIRGVGNFTLHPNSDPTVGFSYDGVFIGRPMGTLSQMFDLDRVELFKGPQGVLYGRNASAGSINLEPRQPQIGKTAGSVDLTTTSLGEVRGEAAINLSIGENAALRLSSAVSSADELLEGYRDGPQQHSARAQIRALLGDRVSVRLSADYNAVGGVGVGSSYVGNYVYDRALGRYRFIESGLPLSRGIYSTEGQAFRQTIFLNSAGRLLDSIASRPEQDHEFYGTHAHLQADLQFADLIVIPAWRKSSLHATVSGAPFGYLQDERNEQASVEARLSGRAGPLDWLAGSFLFDESLDSTTMTNLSSALARSEQRYRTFSKAFFANVTLHASQRIRVGGGLRWTVDRKKYRSASETLAIICPPIGPNPPNCPTAPLFPLVDDFSEVPFPIPVQPGTLRPILVGGIPTGAVVSLSELERDGSLVDRAVTWRVGTEVDIGPRALFYATIETGYRPGGFNTATGFETYDPERIKAYTLGLRHRAADGNLQVDLEAFWWDYRDQQVSSLRPDLGTPVRNANITDNIGNSRIRGIEADVGLAPWRDAKLRAVVQYLDAEYRSFDYIQSSQNVPPLTGCTASLSRANLYTVDCRQKQPYNSPRWSLTFEGRQTFPIGNMSLTAVAGTSFRSARNVGFAFLPEQRIGATWTSNAQLILSGPRKRFEVAAFVRNIEGDRVPQFMIFHPVSNALIAGTSPPRKFGLRASLRF